METAVPTCTICLENIQAAEISTISPCQHTFCHKCITGWLSQKSHCPLCQKEVENVEYLDKSGKKIVSAVDLKKNFVPKEEDFECLDHDHFLDQYEKLLQKAEETEFDIKCLLNLKRNSSEVEQSYNMINQIIYEIEMKLSFLEKRKKIDPKSLVEDVHHFSDLLENFRVKSKGYDSEKYADYYDDDYDECYYEQYVSSENQDVSPLDVKPQKNKSKKKAKKAKKGAEMNQDLMSKNATLVSS